jgi:hypothetical protein
MDKIVNSLIVLVISIGIVAGALAGKRSTSDELIQERINRSAVSPEPMNEEVQTGLVTWKIVSVEEVGPILRQDRTGATLETRGKFVSIRFEVVNEGEEAKFIYDLRLVDDRGHTYTICAAAYAYMGVEEACMMADLLPEVKRTFTMSHDVPLNAEDLWLEVTDLNVPPKKKAYIELGI